MTWFHLHAVTRRADASRLVVTLLFVVLAVGFFRIQVLGAHRYELQSTNNRLRPVTLPAPRGLIVDRNGVVLAENEPGYTIALLASDEDSLRSTLERIADRANLDSLKIEAILRRFRRLPHEPAIVLRDAPFDLVSALEEARVMVPGLVIQTEPKRNYPYNEATAHVLAMWARSPNRSWLRTRSQEREGARSLAETGSSGNTTTCYAVRTDNDSSK